MQGRRGGGGDRKRAGEEERGGDRLRHVRAHGCGLRAYEDYRRAVVEEVGGATEGEALSVVSSPKSSKKLTAWRGERRWGRRRNSPWMRSEVDMAGRTS